MCIAEAPGSRTWPPPFFPPPQSLLLDNKPTCIGNHHGGQPLELSLYMYCVDNHLAPHHGAASHSRTNTTIGREPEQCSQDHKRMAASSIRALHDDAERSANRIFSSLDGLSRTRAEKCTLQPTMFVQCSQIMSSVQLPPYFPFHRLARRLPYHTCAFNISHYITRLQDESFWSQSNLACTKQFTWRMAINRSIIHNRRYYPEILRRRGDVWS